METNTRLKTNRDTLLEQYNVNLDGVYDMQDTLLQSILPSLSDELGLPKEVQEWAREWLSDTGSMFRISRRNKFTRSFSLEAVQKNLQWRLENLWPPHRQARIPNFYCLPAKIRDPFGRPILVIRLVGVDNSESLRTQIVEIFEQLRLFLRQLYDESPNGIPTLQFVVLLDLGELSLRAINLDLLTWVSNEVIPRFPGMIAAVFILNYSWAHAGIWSVVKRLLPESALSRVFFPTNKDLLDCLTPAAVPQEFGGSLPSLRSVEDPLYPPTGPVSSDIVLEPAVVTAKIASSVHSTPLVRMSSTSALNPFFGYPISASSTRDGPALRHGRRRKRDLFRTLVKLFWLRWQSHLKLGFYLATLVVVMKLVLNRRWTQLLRRTFSLP
ncbi:CRAL-TRIO domain-containing protein [Crepidotus variabilis]|uniref:CRAL-TRIO domain-containing protein n=1 Tax=Crepidotus variabilis TaxID=179855 RepID=A0A9P6EDA3_9AGAR|nr:CRAL-TRIO domain-containing protein [Crepidotus variabilis]